MSLAVLLEALCSLQDRDVGRSALNLNRFLPANAGARLVIIPVTGIWSKLCSCFVAKAFQKEIFLGALSHFARISWKGC